MAILTVGIDPAKNEFAVAWGTMATHRCYPIRRCFRPFSQR